MTKEQAILNAEMVMKYLQLYEPQAYLTLDICRSDIRIHFFDLEATDKEVEEVAKKLEALLIAGTEIEYLRNESLNLRTFDLLWKLWK